MDIQDKIIRYIQGQLKGDEKDAFFEWLNSDLHNKQKYFQEKDVWDRYRMHGEGVKIQAGKEWQRFQTRISDDKPEIYLVVRKRLGNWIRIAALFILVFGLGWGSSYVLNSIDEAGGVAHELRVPKGQRSQLILADGTEVWLNSDSKLNFSEHLLEGKRQVTLEGEAFFEVARDEKHPFIVKTQDQELEVLGTAFNVRAYGKEPLVHTTLVHGKVRVLAGERKIILKPGQQLELNRYSKSMELKNVDTQEYTAWRDGRYVFENEEFDVLLRMVERWYDVKFVYPEKYFEKMHYSGVIKRIKPLEHVLRLINYTTPIEYEIKGDEVIILPKNRESERN